MIRASAACSIGFFGSMIAASVLASGCRYVNTRESGYATLEEAGRDGAIAEGRIPGGLPPSAREVRERHRVDGTGAWGRFEFDEGDRASLGGACERVDVARAPLPGSETRATAWWAEMLRSDSSTAAEHFEVYACAPAGRAGRWYLAVHRRLPTAFFWTSP